MGYTRLFKIALCIALVTPHTFIRTGGDTGIPAKHLATLSQLYNSNTSSSWHSSSQHSDDTVEVSPQQQSEQTPHEHRSYERIVVRYVQPAKVLPVVVAFAAGWMIARWQYKDAACTKIKCKKRKPVLQSDYSDGFDYHYEGIYE
jgi:hypothetical protein